MMNRSEFIKNGLLGLSIMPVVPSAAMAWQGNTREYDKTTVKEFVGAGHNDLEKVKAMLEVQPNLLYARYDWGGGDFEEAIGGAGHVGNKEIANYLIDKGARVNLFVLTMLGKEDLVIPVLQEYPRLIRAKGPHGFSLLHHAKVGGAEAKDIHDYLIDKGLRETKWAIN